MKNKHKLFTQMAELVAGQSTCCRMQVGAILVKDSRVISIGFNGTPSGQEHCEDHFARLYETDFKDQFPTYEEYRASRTFYDAHGKWSIENELHAEQNAIIQAARLGVSIDGGTLYCTHQPCAVCAKMIVNAGIVRVVYEHGYPDEFAVQMMKEGGVELCRFGEMT